MVSRRRNIIRKDVPIQKGSFKIKKPLEELETNGNAPQGQKFSDRFIKTEDEKVRSSDQVIRITNQKASIKMITNDKLNNNYVQSNNCMRNSDRLRKSRSSNNYISVPKKQSTRSTRSNVELNNSYNREKSASDLKQEVKEEINIAVKPANPRKRRKLTEEDISVRMRAISEKLKKVSEEIFDEEEDERLEIEHKLMSLNKDSFMDDYPDYDERNDDDEEQILGVVNSRTSNKPNGVSLISEGCEKPIIVTQKPDGQLHSCPSCSEVFLSELDLFRHKRDAHRPPKITMDANKIKEFYDNPDRSKCPICNKALTCTTKSFFISHLLSHNRVGEFVCSICKRVFKRPDHMKMHEKRHIV